MQAENEEKFGGLRGGRIAWVDSEGGKARRGVWGRIGVAPNPLAERQAGGQFVPMRNRYTAVVQRDGKWFIAFCPEVPEANGQGKPREACLESLAAAIELVLDYRREQGLEKAPRGAEQTFVLV